ncbi:Trans-acting regulatory protein HvrA (plasmid) [Sulfitobacter indolifex]|uniref:Histone-like protein of HNS family n=1 Tax=Sulfitobacter indolifex HEL-45 TaxID=391624 RepID=A0ABM9X060_9RHOB|nr:H-NS histone family protein [Sulfitobacter indolifex]EDQ02858.1 Histone-like protein of HNS family [Sulfitobacter indolifex HEL-45]UOA21368.1 Trans-acting regulatory protein HvrA [Sulfitobacter indolifex]
MFDKNELKALSRKELEKLLADVKKALSSVQARDQREAKKAATKAAAEFGFSLNDITETAALVPKKRKTKAKAAKKQSKPVFFNPEDTNQTWTGKGRQPNWYREQIATGMDPEAMRIKN